jgi:hypothetical protein
MVVLADLLYAKRWGLYKSESLRRAYAKARKLYSEDPMFKFSLCGLDALISGASVDEVEQAIELHALDDEDLGGTVAIRPQRHSKTARLPLERRERRQTQVLVRRCRRGRAR